MIMNRWMMLAAVLAVGVIGMTFGSAQSHSPVQETFVSHLQSRSHAAADSRPFNSLDDLLGNVRYSMPDGPTKPITAAVVVGHIEEVTPGMGFYVKGADAATGIETDFADPRAIWRTVHATLTIDRVLSGSVGDSPTEVGFAVGVTIPFDQIRNDLLAFDSVLLFLEKGQAVFDYDPSVYGTTMDGALLGTVSTDGSISLPVLDPAEEAELLNGAGTVESLVSAARQPGRNIRLDATGVVIGGNP